MRSVKEINKELIAHRVSTSGITSTPEQWEKIVEKQDSLLAELLESITEGIPLDRLEAICAAEREEVSHD